MVGRNARKVCNCAFVKKWRKIFFCFSEENGALQELDLSWNNIRKKGGHSLAYSLRKNVGLRKLNLSWNGLALEGCRGFKRSLPDNNTLLELDLSSNRIDAACVQELMTGVTKNDTLRVLKVHLELIVLNCL